MNFKNIYEKQRKLDERIIKEHDIDPNVYDWKLDALRVELHELENEVRHFKVWSKDREMRRDKALIEYVDFLHFLISYSISIGIELSSIGGLKCKEIKNQFREIAYHLDLLYLDNDKFLDTFQLFIGLGDMLGFSWEEIEQAYMNKNSENHRRQDTGY